jgi:hypothetical protein
LPAGCPSSFAAAQATVTACTSLPAGASCTYPEGACACVSGYATLVCTPPAAAGCPASRPLAGTACSNAPGACTAWGTGAPDGQSMTCKCGVWRPVLGYD